MRNASCASNTAWSKVVNSYPSLNWYPYKTLHKTHVARPLNYVLFRLFFLHILLTEIAQMLRMYYLIIVPTRMSYCSNTNWICRFVVWLLQSCHWACATSLQLRFLGWTLSQIRWTSRALFFRKGALSTNSGKPFRTWPQACVSQLAAKPLYRFTDHAPSAVTTLAQNTLITERTSLCKYTFSYNFGIDVRQGVLLSKTNTHFNKLSKTLIILFF